MTKSGEERRKYPRSKSGFHIGPPKKIHDAIKRVDNISENGVLFHTTEAIPVMTKLEINVDIPGPSAKHITAEGVVVRCESDEHTVDEYKVALLFTHINDEDRKAVRHYVDHDLSDSGLAT